MVNPASADSVPFSAFPLPLPSHWPGQSELMAWCQSMSPGVAAILIVGGVIYLLWGWYLFKVLVTLNAALMGAYIGAAIGQRAGSLWAGAALGGFIAALVTWPLMKYAVAVMGGFFGALLGLSLWRTAGLDPNFAWSGGLVGLVAFGMLSFALFRGSIIMYTSLQGSVMLIFGLLGMIYKYQSLSPQITSAMSLRPLLLPILIFIPMMIGLIFQQSAKETPSQKK